MSRSVVPRSERQAKPASLATRFPRWWLNAWRWDIFFCLLAMDRAAVFFDAIGLPPVIVDARSIAAGYVDRTSGVGSKVLARQVAVARRRLRAALSPAVFESIRWWVLKDLPIEDGSWSLVYDALFWESIGRSKVSLPGNRHSRATIQGIFARHSVRDWERISGDTETDPMSEHDREIGERRIYPQKIGRASCRERV